MATKPSSPVRHPSRKDGLRPKNRKERRCMIAVMKMQWKKGQTGKPSSVRSLLEAPMSMVDGSGNIIAAPGHDALRADAAEELGEYLLDHDASIAKSIEAHLPADDGLLNKTIAEALEWMYEVHAERGTESAAWWSSVSTDPEDPFYGVTEMNFEIALAYATELGGPIIDVVRMDQTIEWIRRWALAHEVE